LHRSAVRNYGAGSPRDQTQTFEKPRLSPLPLFVADGAETVGPILRGWRWKAQVHAQMDPAEIGPIDQWKKKVKL